jgi:predicted small integral membrane protein
MSAFAWMAWTWQTALFFATIAALLAIMTALAVWRPETPRLGVLRFPTTRGDRLFISLLGAAFIHLAWVGLIGPSLWWAMAVSLVYAAAVFRYV